jgi:hypothetical protein
MGGGLLGSEGAGIFLFIEQLDSAHPKAIVIEVEFFGGIDRVADLDPLTDIGSGDLVERAFEADGGIVIDDPFVADEEDLIELGPGEPSDEHPAHGSVIAIDGSFLDAGMEFMVIIILEPESKGFIEFIESHSLLESREKSFSHGSKKPFHLSAGRAIIRLGVDEGDPGLGTASSQ